MSELEYSLIVIGAGAGGLVVAIGAAKAGKKVLLIEKGHYGGDCTNFGCIPSKALIASAHIAQAIRTSDEFGIHLKEKAFDAQSALSRVRGIVSQIREEEEPDKLAKHGVETLTGKAHFIDSHTLEVFFEGGGSQKVTGENIVLAVGSHPVIPDIKGLEETPYLTNETLYDLKEIPESLAVLGGGPIGCEMAQAFHRLGSKVSIIQRSGRLLKKEDPEAGERIRECMEKEGVRVFLDCQTNSITQESNKIHLALLNKKSDEHKSLSVDKVLVSVGRKPSVSGLALDKAGVELGQRGEIEIDAYGRTSQKHIWAVGDCNGIAIFTHMAENQARGVLKNLLVAPLKFKLDLKQAIPRCTYTDPEVAGVGLTEGEAKELYGSSKLAIYHVPFSQVDRAITASRTEGFVKIVTKKWSSRILGATVVGERAGEMLQEISLAMQQGIPLRKLAGLIHPYPVYSLAIRKAADQWFTKTVLPSLLGIVKKVKGKS